VIVYLTVRLIVRHKLSLMHVVLSPKHTQTALCQLRALKSTAVNTTELLVSSGDYIVLNDDVWLKLPAPEVRSRIHPASFPGQQYVTMCDANNKCNVNPKLVEPVKQDARNVCKSSVMT